MRAQAVEKEKPSTAENAFEASNACYARFRARMESPEALNMEHAALEKVIEQEGYELMRLLYQDHLRLRAWTEEDARVHGPVVGCDGSERRHRRSKASRDLMTPFGKVEVERAGYSAPGRRSLYPMDAGLNLPQNLFSHGVQERVAREAAKNSYEEVVETIERTSGARLGKRQAEQLAIDASRDFEELYATREEAALEEQEQTGALMVLSVDGKGVCMRPEGLREATRKAAEKQSKQPGPPEKRRKDHKRHAKRMATVAAVYSIEPYVRAPDDIMNNLQGVADADEQAKRPKPENKRVWASMVATPASVIGDAFDEGLRRDPNRRKRWVALVDGNETQLDALTCQAEAKDITLTIVLDLIHVIGYLWKAAKVLGGDSPQEQYKWVKERCKSILQGKCVDVAAGMRRSATLRDLEQETREPVDICARYLLKYRDYLRYDEFLAAGLPIATGVIEGACRHLVQDRMGITGARWGLQGAEAILRLRALHISGDFDHYWRFHLMQERHLNHTMSYADEPPNIHSPPRNCPNRPKLQLVP